jgi:threonine/homoserine/homoserine lactone efflux protein
LSPFVGIAGVIAAAALTPGPNNLVVLRWAARAGVRGALSAIAGTILGSLAMMTLAMAGAAALFATVPAARLALACVGCAYLCWLGARLVVTRAPGTTSGEGPRESALPAGVLGLFVFQFANPKSWVLVLTAVATAAEHLAGLALFVTLATLLALIGSASLLLWAALGAAVQRRWSASARLRLDRALGALLLLSAVSMLAEELR